MIACIDACKINCCSLRHGFGSLSLSLSLNLYLFVSFIKHVNPTHLQRLGCRIRHYCALIWHSSAITLTATVACAVCNMSLSMAPSIIVSATCKMMLLVSCTILCVSGFYIPFWNTTSCMPVQPLSNASITMAKMSSPLPVNS